MTTAMASDMTLMPLGLISLNVSIDSEHFSQNLYLTNASVSVQINENERIDVFVDANTNRIVARSDTADFDVVVQSLRPRERFSYGGHCYIANAAPDTVFETTTTTDTMFPRETRSRGLYHRNVDQDVTYFGKHAMFNETLRQQGLGELVESLQAADRWRHRQFGFLVTSLDAKTSIISTLSKQTNTTDEWERDVAKLHAEHLHEPIENVTAMHRETWTEFWDRSHIWVQDVNSSNVDATNSLTERYAQNRYVQAIQSGTWVPIKFNGMAFATQLPPETNVSGPSFRQWGSCNWWQNTRLSYWNMGFAGDFDRFVTLFEYYMQMMPFLRARTRAAFRHGGVYVTETKTLFGAYDPCNYGTSADDRNSSTDLPFGYEESRWMQFDFGGDAGLTELSMMILDYYLLTRDERAMLEYMPLLAETLDFFYYHYGDLSKDGANLTIFPTQALETYQCPTIPATRGNCPTNDHPTVAALHVLTERALRLPEIFGTSDQRDRWNALAKAVPPVPMIVEDNATLVVSPYETFNDSGTVHLSNVETPELYSTHPFRYYTLGRSFSDDGARDIGPSIYCLEKSKRQTCRNADSNTGWTQGLLNAALLGRATKAATDTLARAQTPPATGYRFPAFMPHFQDYEPSEDHLANMNSALQLMLVSFRDDGVGGVLLFPAWPCSWNVDFKLHAPYNAIIKGSFENGKLVSLVVDPPERTSSVKVMPCQKISG
eukprot:g1726.t1